MTKIAEKSKQEYGDLLKEKDYLQDMEQLEMTIVSIQTPYPSIVRIQGKINTLQPELWQAPNLAIRLIVSNPPEGQPISRVYTVRSFNPVNTQIEIDFVKHEDLSPAMEWLNSAQVGTKIGLIGPRPHFIPNFTAKKHVVMFADDTAVPALYSILKQWELGISADIFIESFEKDIASQLPELEHVKIHSFHKEHHTSQKGLLLKAAFALENYENITIWAACERNEARALRQFFLEDQQLNKNDVRIAGYWRDGVSSSELDKLRAQHYQKHIQQGKTLNEYDDLDLAN
ncbi:acinetobactin utilization protein BauF [Acinetobacter baumannii]|uniref:acinetobactin utilization protein BauF n=1 Tax=Acinetobacter baumannii TaxID=470 RepID=UPI0024DE410E|nr:acinetobactin utilization protein BauF [Acinetobacter baumannii]MDK2185570.1 acinetobactin utilization protein BauF [Acinetobacter baumannii]MDK2258379.1 acinetobactin utilization protein BauF [Acinetobacter baumannii]MDK2265853.1 acinetobactin utilization protein BauF [Acinetobacter baumannii]MDK2273154.1 acinetobactin utilization protein BauF [Acinetobacter baumannii]MDK2287343.1 acinetobactin utilization protein BauF [Acinetobacter baumannii]